MTRWANSLTTGTEVWGAAEDRKLGELVQKHGNKWFLISKELPGHSIQYLKSRRDPICYKKREEKSLSKFSSQISGKFTVNSLNSLRHLREHAVSTASNSPAKRNEDYAEPDCTAMEASVGSVCQPLDHPRKTTQEIGAQTSNERTVKYAYARIRGGAPVKVAVVVDSDGKP